MSESSSTAARLQLAQRESPMVLGRKWNTAHLLQITAAGLSLATVMTWLKVHVGEMSQIFPPQTQLATLCAWQMTYVLNLTRKAEIKEKKSSTVFWSHQMSVVMTSWRHIDRQACLTLPRRLETQGELRSYCIKHTICALITPTCSGPLHPRTNSEGKSFC